MKRTLRVKVSRGVMPRKFSPFNVELEEIIQVSDDNRDKARKKLVIELKKVVDKVCERVLEEEYKDED